MPKPSKLSGPRVRGLAKGQLSFKLKLWRGYALGLRVIMKELYLNKNYFFIFTNY